MMLITLTSLPLILPLKAPDKPIEQNTSLHTAME